MSLLTLIIGLLFLAESTCLAQTGQEIFVQCDKDGDPWIESYCILIEGETPTTVTMMGVDSSTSFTLFDNILDRNCLLVLRTQPDFWQTVDSTDSSKIVLPFPVVSSGRYYIEVRTSDTAVVDTLVLLR